MSAGYQELFLEQGASFNSTITLDDVYGDNYNLTDFGGACQIKKSYYSSNAIAVMDTVILPESSSISLRLGANVTANIAPGRYVYDVLIYSHTDAANNTIRVLEGIINVTPGVTKV